MKYHGVAAVGLIAVLAIVLGGCGFFTKTGWKTGEDSDREPGLNLREYEPIMGENEYETLDEAYARMARIVPGFGGIFFDDFETLNVYLTDLSKAQEAFARLEPLLLDYFGRDAEIIPPTSTWKIRQGRYDYVQLYQWHSKLWSLFQSYNVLVTDIDEANNRITIGFESSVFSRSLVGSVTQKIISLGVPLEAIVFKEAAPVHPTQSDTLQGKHRPVIGGIQSQAQDNGACTLMLPVRHGTYGLGFITNSHCAKPQGVVSNPPLKLHQPHRITDSPAVDVIGFERLDAPIFHGTDRTNNPKGNQCLVGERCRWSDSAFFRVASGVTLNQGMIAAVAQQTPFGVEPGNLSVVGQWAVVAFVRFPPQGLAINKVGRTTGWTSDTIDETCIRLWDAEMQIFDLCTYTSRLWATFGDSGAPVFAFRPNNTLVLLGIVMGRTPPDWGLGALYSSYFSPLGGIMRSLGMGGGFCAGNLC